MRNRYEQLTKKQLIKFIKTIRPKADAYDRVCQVLGIKKNIIGYVQQLKANKAHTDAQNNEQKGGAE